MIRSVPLVLVRRRSKLLLGCKSDMNCMFVLSPGQGVFIVSGFMRQVLGTTTGWRVPVGERHKVAVGCASGVKVAGSFLEFLAQVGYLLFKLADPTWLTIVDSRQVRSLICEFAAGDERSCALNSRPEPVQTAGSWKCQMISDGRPPAARAADGR